MDKKVVNILGYKPKVSKIRRESMINFGNCSLFPNQYFSLVNILENYEKVPQDLISLSKEEKISRIESKGGLLSKLDLSGIKIQVRGRAFEIPGNLIGLEHIDLFSNNLVYFGIPSTLKNLRYLSCSMNNLGFLEIPDTLSNLSFFNCSDNYLTRLEIPQTFHSLIELYTKNNSLKLLEISNNILASIEVFSYSKDFLSNDKIKLFKRFGFYPELSK